MLGIHCSENIMISKAAGELCLTIGSVQVFKRQKSPDPDWVYPNGNDLKTSQPYPVGRYLPQMPSFLTQCKKYGRLREARTFAQMDQSRTVLFSRPSFSVEKRICSLHFRKACPAIAIHS